MIPFTLAPVRNLLSDPTEMASGKNLLRPYSVEIAPAAWAQVAQLPRESYVALQERLRALAEQASSRRLFREGAPALSVALGDFVARYEVDEAREVLRLLEVARVARGPAEVAPGVAPRGLPSSSE